MLEFRFRVEEATIRNLHLVATVSHTLNSNSASFRHFYVHVPHGLVQSDPPLLHESLTLPHVSVWMRPNRTYNLNLLNFLLPLHLKHCYIQSQLHNQRFDWQVECVVCTSGSIYRSCYFMIAELRDNTVIMRANQTRSSTDRDLTL